MQGSDTGPICDGIPLRGMPMHQEHVPAILVDIEFRDSTDGTVLFLEWDLFLGGTSELEVPLKQIPAFCHLVGIPILEFLEDPLVLLASAWHATWLEERQGWWFQPEPRN